MSFKVGWLEVVGPKYPEMMLDELGTVFLDSYCSLAEG